jgi:hypothetical protein
MPIRYETPGFSGDEDLAELLDSSRDGGLAESLKETRGLEGEDLTKLLDSSRDGGLAESLKETRGLAVADLILIE